MYTHMPYCLDMQHVVRRLRADLVKLLVCAVLGAGLGVTLAALLVVGGGSSTSQHPPLTHHAELLPVIVPAQCVPASGQPPPVEPLCNPVRARALIPAPHPLPSR